LSLFCQKKNACRTRADALQQRSCGIARNLAHQRSSESAGLVVGQEWPCIWMDRGRPGRVRSGRSCTRRAAAGFPLGVIRDRSRRSCLPIHVLFELKASVVLGSVSSGSGRRCRSRELECGRYASRYAKPLAIGALSGRPPFAASGTLAPPRRWRCVEGELAAPAGERKNLVLHAWRKKPKHWRAITRPAIRFFSKGKLTILG
jgi:hypothetical protein